MTVPTIAIVAFIKVYLIGIYFIELRYASRVLKLNFNAYQLRRVETGAPMWSYVELLGGPNELQPVRLAGRAVDERGVQCRVPARFERRHHPASPASPRMPPPT